MEQREFSPKRRGKLKLETLCRSVYGHARNREYFGVRSEEHHRHAPYYWSADGKEAKGEVDFIVERDGAPLPIEVKAGGNTAGRSLARFCEAYGLERAVTHASQNLACLDCHKSHRASVMVCAECHTEAADIMPEGWVDAREGQTIEPVIGIVG